jgi:hypothetical protein
MIRFQKKSLAISQAREEHSNDFHLRQPGNRAASGLKFSQSNAVLDPRLCVPVFQRVCYFRILIDDIIATGSTILPFTSVI